MKEAKAKEAVENGERLLDREIPGWDEEINLPSLDIGNCRQCVMGQLFGLYSTGVARLGIEDGELYGLNFDYFKDLRPEDLNEAWRDVVVARRASEARLRPTVSRKALWPPPPTALLVS